MKKNFLLLFTTFLLFTLTATGCSNKVSGNLGKDGIKLVGFYYLHLSVPAVVIKFPEVLVRMVQSWLEPGMVLEML